MYKLAGTNRKIRDKKYLYIFEALIKNNFLLFLKWLYIEKTFGSMMDTCDSL